MPKKILVIDDIESVRREIRSYINPPVSAQSMVLQIISKNSGETQPPRHLVDEAAQGGDGVNRARQALAQGEGYDLIIVDLAMPPGIDGIETIRQIRAFDASTQIIICTGNGFIPKDEICQANRGDMPLVFYKPEISGIKDVIAKLN